MIYKEKMAIKNQTRPTNSMTCRPCLIFVAFWLCISAEAGGFEPPVQLPVRQFSKLLVSATHPHFLVDFREIGCKYTCLFLTCQRKDNIFVEQHSNNRMKSTFSNESFIKVRHFQFLLYYGITKQVWLCSFSLPKMCYFCTDSYLSLHKNGTSNTPGQLSIRVLAKHDIKWNK